MTTGTGRPADLEARLGALSPEKQALLARRLAAQRAAAAPNGMMPNATAIPRRDGDGPAPLTAAQELLWLYEQMTPGTPTYNLPMARRVRGPLDLAALQTAVDGLVARHESLRTTFVERDGEPQQAVAAARPVPITVHDLRGSDENVAQADRLLREAAAAPFSLVEGTWPRVVVARLARDEALLLVVVHHVVFDGGSAGVLFRDLTILYAAAVAGSAASLPALPIQLADYATWERATLTDAHLGPALAWWRGYLADASPDVELPMEASRTSRAGPGARHARVVATVPPASVRALAAANGTTPFAVLLAAFAAVLHRYSGQDDLVVGTTIAGRERAETADLVGYLANTLAVRTRVGDGTTFAELLRRVRDDLLRAFEYRDVPYERLVRELRAGRPAAEQALFRVMFTMQDAGGPGARLGDATLEPFGVDAGAAKFDLTVSASEVAGGFRIAVEYRRDLMREGTINRLVGHFGELLCDAVARPDTPVAGLALLPDAERRLVVDAWNATARAYPAGETLVDLLTAQASRTPDAVAVEDERCALTYAALHGAAAALAGRLRALGVGPGALVAVGAERSVELVVALVAVVQAGGAYVPLDPAYPADRLADMLADSGARVLLAPGALAATLPVGTATLVALDGVADTGGIDADAPPLPVPTAADPAYLLYTSGSTGRPKGALNAHRGIVNRLRWMQDTYALGPADVVLQKTPVSFDVSVWEVFWPLIAGATLVLARPGGHRDPAYLAAVIQQRGVTVCHFVPSMLRAFLADRPAAARCASLRDVMASGEALAPDLVAAFYRALPHARLHNLYGPTECAVDVTAWACPPSPEPPAVVPIGRPIANTQAYVLDAHRRPQPVGVAGELYLGGVQVGLGYHERPALTAERFVPDPFSPAPAARLYRTGDRARWRPDGTLEYLGRLDFQVKLRGVRIELGEIESALLKHPAVHDAVVVARPLWEGGDPQLVGYWVPRGDVAPPDAAALRAHLAAALPDAMVPAALVPLASLPLGTSGKLDRKALPAPTIEEPAEQRVAPRDDVEAVVAELWGDALGRTHVGVESNFFDLGGHSLVATRLAGQVAKIFRTPLPLRRFFERPTVAGVARAIVEAEPKRGQAAAIARLFLKARRMTPEEREQVRRGAAPVGAAAPAESA